ncbi:MAG: class I SAM-dependent methyltransferase [Lysobacter sp.]
MPAFAHDRQPALHATGLDWFASPAGQGVLATEAAAVARVLSGCPALPWAWLGVGSALPPPGGRRGVLLHREGVELVGSVRCRLPLPMASETFGAVLVQHVLDEGRDQAALLEECARVLTPGGTLWLATLNPWSPYRARWTGRGLHARDPGRWQRMLRRAGFAGGSIRLQWLGPHWHPGHGEAGVAVIDRFRASIAITVSKRAPAMIPPTPLRQLRWQAGRWQTDDVLRAHQSDLWQRARR